MKEKIIELSKARRTPKSIYLAWAAEMKDTENHQVPKIRQIRNVLIREDSKEYGKAPLTMRQLTDLVTDRSAISDDIDEPYVVQFERSPSSVHPQDGFYGLFISTKKLRYV